MTLIDLLIAVIVIALVLWVLTLLPIEANARRILSIAVAVLLVLWLLVHLFPDAGSWRFGGPTVR